MAISPSSRRSRKSSEFANLNKFRMLATHPEEDWVRLVKAQVAAGKITLPIEVDNIAGRSKLPAAEIYGKTLARQFREAFPTMAFAGGLQRAIQNGGLTACDRAGPSQLS